MKRKKYGVNTDVIKSVSCSAFDVIRGTMWVQTWTVLLAYNSRGLLWVYSVYSEVAVRVVYSEFTVRYVYGEFIMRVVHGEFTRVVYSEFIVL